MAAARKGGESRRNHDGSAERGEVIVDDESLRDRSGRLFPAAPKTEVDEELAFHLQERIQEFIDGGMTPEAARAAALDRLGNLNGVRRECTELLSEERRLSSRRDWLSDLGQDVRFGVRAALRDPRFSVLAIITLALGIGANSAVFGVVKSVLLDALPYADASQLVRVYTVFDTEATHSSISPGLVVDVERQQRSFSDVAWFNAETFDHTYIADDVPRVLIGAWVGGNFFRTLGVNATVGRTPSLEDVASGAAPVVMLSQEAWVRDFGADASIVGQTIRIDGSPFVVTGVLPPHFVGPQGKADLWFPFSLTPILADLTGSRNQHWMSFVARLKPGVTIEAAQRDVATIAAQATREFPNTDTGRTLTTLSLRDDMVGDTRTPLLVLLASAALVLLITCANLAGAQLSRTLARRKEFAVRVALGAGRGRLIRQLLTETTLLAIAGGAAGILLAQFGLAGLRNLALPTLPPYADLALDRGAVLITGALAIATGLLFGLTPALAVGRTSPQQTLREETRSATDSRGARRTRGLLVAGQIALSVSLLVGAALLVRSVWAITSAPLGFEPKSALTGSVQLTARAYPTPEARGQLFDQLEERLRTLPGVTSVASSTQLPSPEMSRNILLIDGRVMDTEAPIFIPYMAVSDDYFRTMQIAVKSGRTFGSDERADGTPAIVISESLARAYWPNGDAIGARIQISPLTVEQRGVVVGIVADVRLHPTEPQLAQMAYASTRRDMLRGSRTYVLRAQGNPLALLQPFQQELSALDATLPVRNAKTLEALLGDNLAARRLPMLLMMAFGALALLLASVGVYAMFANMAAAREQEFGVRVALGSSRSAIATLVLRQGLLWLMIGLAVGAIGVLFVSRALRDLLYEVSPLDPIALGVAAVTLLVCAALALLVPVRRATRVDPRTVLY